VRTRRARRAPARRDRGLEDPLSAGRGTRSHQAAPSHLGQNEESSPWTLAERLISELSETEFHPEKYEDEYRQRLLKAIEQKIAGQEIQRVEVETRPPTTDLVATLEASLARKELAKVSPGKSKREPVAEKRPARRKRAS
jgi:non-homologous end joining protein Ku